MRNKTTVLSVQWGIGVQPILYIFSICSCAFSFVASQLWLSHIMEESSHVAWSHSSPRGMCIIPKNGSLSILVKILLYCQRVRSINEKKILSFSGPCKMRSSSNVGLMFGQRRRRWPNIKPTSGVCFVLTGLYLCVAKHHNIHYYSGTLSS